MLRREIEEYLEDEPRARERRFKDRALVNILLKKHPALSRVPKEVLIGLVQDFNSLDRYWRMILMERPELRGVDYEDKVRYEQEKELGLGYEPRYRQNISSTKFL